MRACHMQACACDDMSRLYNWHIGSQLAVDAMQLMTCDMHVTMSHATCIYVTHMAWSMENGGWIADSRKVFSLHYTTHNTKHKVDSME
jgi:hypothetical protein